MKIEQNNEPVKHDDIHEQIDRIAQVADENYVYAVLVGDVMLNPGRISIRSSCGVHFPEDVQYVQDENLVVAIFAGMLVDSMRQNKLIASSVMLAASMHAEDRIQMQNKINLN